MYPFVIETTQNAFDVAPALGEWTISVWGWNFGAIHKIGKSKPANVVERVIDRFWGWLI